MAIEPIHGSIQDYWRKEEIAGSIARPPNYGERFGFSKNRFQEFTKHFKLDEAAARTTENVNLFIIIILYIIMLCCN